MKSWHLPSLTLLALSCLTSATYIPSLSARDSSLCATNSSSSPCPDGIRFCCASGTTCLFTTTNSDSVLCCPTGQDCSYIKPISCDIQQQNATQNPTSAVQTINLSASLTTCGSSCCPFGYSCSAGMCTINKSTNSPSSGSSTTKPTSTGTPLVVPTSTSLPSTDTSTKSQGFSSGAIGVGIIIGILIMLVLLAAWFGYKRLQKRRRMDARDDRKRQISSPSFMGKTPTFHNQGYERSYGAESEGGDSSATKRFSSAAQLPASNPAASHTRSASNVAEPMWADSTLQAPPVPLNRTDVWLRRGSCETGYENALQPSWSTRKSPTGVTVKRSQASLQPTAVKEDTSNSTERGRSRRTDKYESINRSNPFESTKAADGPSQEMASRTDRQPLFAKPLRLTPQAPASIGVSPERKRPAPTRPARSDEHVPQVATLDNSRARADSDDQGLLPSAAYSGRPRQHRRHSSISQYSLTGDRTPLRPTASSETINILLTPEPAARTQRHSSSRRDTTFSDLMRKAGWKRGLDGGKF